MDFAVPIPANAKVHVEYWGSHWPLQYLPNDPYLGSGYSGWMELGDWYNGGWRIADTAQTISGNSIHSTFEPINTHEYPQLTNYFSTGRFTLKIRITGNQPLPEILRIQALTDSTLTDREVRVAWEKPPAANFRANAFNGQILSTTTHERTSVLRIQAAVNSDPNSFDRTLVTLKNGTNEFTFGVNDLTNGALYLPEYGAAILPNSDRRDYATVAADVRRVGQKTLYQRIAEMPEQTWPSAWCGMPPKKSRIEFVLGLDGARQKFRLEANGDITFRTYDQYLESVPGNDTPRFALEKSPVIVRFGLSQEPTERHIQDESIPTCVTTWNHNGVAITQTAFATTLNGIKPRIQPTPDACAVAMVRFDFTNTTDSPEMATLPISILSDTNSERLRIDNKGLIWNGNQLRGQIVIVAQVSKSADIRPPKAHRIEDVSSGFNLKIGPSTNGLAWTVPLAAHETKSIILKLPYLPLIKPSEAAALAALKFVREQRNTAEYWRAILNRSANLITPEPDLTDFYRAVAGHLLINCETEPGSNRRFARVGSFRYGVYPNESSMMILDLDRRGYHQVAEECLDTWLHYQGTARMPGDFDSTNGILYGASGYEAGGYNQGQGWVLWTLAQHFRFTRDKAWLLRVAPNVVAGSDWIIHETARTANRPDLGNGLLPPGDLEDITDWWTWLSTSCYTWRGLDGAAWALEQIHDPNAPRIRAAADAYHANLVNHFLSASALSPVVHLHNGTAVPQIPSYAQCRGRSFGWIRQTLEGAMHLLITRAIDPKSIRATWILEDYEDNLFLSDHYGYHVDNFDKEWFDRGGMSMQACLLLTPDVYLCRDDVKQALRATFNAFALNHFPDVHMNAEHALPQMGDWLGDVYKSSDEANVCGWLREIFVREDGDVLLVGQAVPRDWLKPGRTCGIENTVTYFGNASILYQGGSNSITAKLRAPTRNPPREIHVRFRTPEEQPLTSVTVNGKAWKNVDANWVIIPGNISHATIIATY